MIYRILLLGIIFLAFSCRGAKMEYTPPEEMIYNTDNDGLEIEITFIKGKEHNHPLMAVWIESDNGQFIQTLYIAESIGKGVFKRGDPSSGKWMPGEIRRPAALPYWSHRRGIKASDGLFIPEPENPVPDAYTGPTPSGNFILHTKIENKDIKTFTIYFEINQSWDWNEYWTNNKCPDDKEYKTSCQPALVYSARIDTDNLQPEYVLRVTGHSHYSGQNGELYDDLSTITTALEIAREIKVKIRK